jgi:hypothetical protein
MVEISHFTQIPSTTSGHGLRKSPDGASSLLSRPILLLLHYPPRMRLIRVWYPRPLDLNQSTTSRSTAEKCAAFSVGSSATPSPLPTARIGRPPLGKQAVDCTPSRSRFLLCFLRLACHDATVHPGRYVPAGTLAASRLGADECVRTYIPRTNERFDGYYISLRQDPHLSLH